MEKSIFIKVVLLCCINNICFGLAVVNSPKVKTEQGILTGVTFNEAHAFYGVPYGSDVSGQNRFTEASPAQKYDNGELNVSNTSNIYCPQRLYNCSFGFCDDDIIQTEECLVLNVHVPTNVDLSNSSAPPSELLPILFWIHGGGFRTVSANLPLFDGRYLSNSTNAIVVAINCRLSSLGFLVYSDENETINGNQGFKDQQLALSWVQQNIHKFGGDKDKITIFGESSGAQSVIFHTVSNVSRPLYKNAIQQSNGLFYQYTTLEEAKRTTAKLLNFTGCNGQGIQCLRSKTFKELVDAGYLISEEAEVNHDWFNIVEPFRPVVDGIEFTDQPLKLFQQGLWNDNKGMIIGTTTEEYTGKIDGIEVLTENLFRSLNEDLYGVELGKTISDYYINEAGSLTDYTDVWNQALTDGRYICPSRALARFASDTTQDGAKVFLYSFAHAPNGTTCPLAYPEELCGHSFHAAELPFVFASEELGVYRFSPEDYNVANQFSYFWGNFAHSGDPNFGDVNVAAKNFPEWPVYNRSTSKNILIDYWSPTVEENYREEACDFWDTTGYYVEVTSPTTTSPTTTSPIPTTSGNVKMYQMSIWALLLLSLSILAML